MAKQKLRGVPLCIMVAAALLTSAADTRAVGQDQGSHSKEKPGEWITILHEEATRRSEQSSQEAQTANDAYLEGKRAMTKAKEGLVNARTDAQRAAARQAVQDAERNLAEKGKQVSEATQREKYFKDLLGQAKRERDRALRGDSGEAPSNNASTAPAQGEIAPLKKLEFGTGHVFERLKITNKVLQEMKNQPVEDLVVVPGQPLPRSASDPRLNTKTDQIVGEGIRLWDGGQPRTPTGRTQQQIAPSSPLCPKCGYPVWQEPPPGTPCSRQ